MFRVAPNGALTAVAGSPFPSYGRAPTSLGLAGNTLIVANKAQDGVRNLRRVPFATVCNALALHDDPAVPPFFTTWRGGGGALARLRNRLAYRVLRRIVSPIIRDPAIAAATGPANPVGRKKRANSEVISARPKRPPAS